MTIKRGRKSVADLMIADSAQGVIANYPDAPYTLTDAEVEEWNAIVRSMQPGYFTRQNYPILTQLCRHVVASNRIAQLSEAVSRAKKFDEAKWASYNAMQNAESSAIIRLSRQLRLSPQQVYRGELVKVRPVNQMKPPPWQRKSEDEEDDEEEA